MALQSFGGYRRFGYPGVVSTSDAPMLDCNLPLSVPAGYGSHEARVRPTSSLETNRSERNARVHETVTSKSPSAKHMPKELSNSLAQLLRREREFVAKVKRHERQYRLQSEVGSRPH